VLRVVCVVVSVLVPVSMVQCVVITLCINTLVSDYSGSVVAGVSGNCRTGTGAGRG